MKITVYTEIEYEIDVTGTFPNRSSKREVEELLAKRIQEDANELGFTIAVTSPLSVHYKIQNPDWKPQPGE